MSSDQDSVRETAGDAPRVFISYAHSDVHAPMVLDLADRLRADGIDAWIDQYEQSPPDGWRIWMEHQLSAADFVLIVASKLYKERAERTAPPTSGFGVRLESTLMLDDLYDNGMYNVKFIPIVLRDEDQAHLVNALRSYQRHSLYFNGGYERLYRHLTDQPEVTAPPLGKIKKLMSKFRGQPETLDVSPQDLLKRSPSKQVPSRDGGGGLGQMLMGDATGSSRGSSGDSALSVPKVDIPNPYNPWTPAVPPLFQGRRSELRRLEQALTTGFGVSVVGDSRIGKSSLLRTFQQLQQRDGRTVRYLDGQGPEGASIQTFVAKIVRGTVADVPESADGAADALASWVEAENSKSDRLPVILVDELDSLPGRFDPRFFERLRNLIGKIVLVVASRVEVDKLYEEQGRTSPFDNLLKLVRLGLAKDAVDPLVELGRPLMDDDDPDQMRRWAGSHPLYLHLFGHHLIDARIHDETEDEAVDRFRDEAASRLRDLWRRLDEKEQETLKAIARGETVSRRSLERRGVLDREGRAFGEVLLDWLREEL